MNPLMPSPLEALMIAVYLIGILIGCVAMLTLIWVLLVPKRRRQVVTIFRGRKAP